jgi:hypothetical protein
MAHTGHVGSPIASAAALPLGASIGNIFSVTGTTAVTSMTVAASAASAGRYVYLVFASAGCKIAHKGTGFQLHGPFNSYAGSVLELVCLDGVTWREVRRSNDAPFETDLGTSEALTSLCEIGVASNGRVTGIFEFEVYATDATDYQTRAGSHIFSAVNKAGTVTCAIQTPNTVPLETQAAALSSGTLTSAITIAAGTLKATIKAQPVSSLTQTAAAIRWRVRMVNGEGSDVTGVVTVL